MYNYYFFSIILLFLTVFNLASGIRFRYRRDVLLRHDVTPHRGYGASWLDGNAARRRILRVFLMFVCSLQTQRTGAVEEGVRQDNGPHGEAVVPDCVSLIRPNGIKQYFVVIAVIVVNIQERPVPPKRSNMVQF